MTTLTDPTLPTIPADPVESIIYTALCEAGIDFCHESTDKSIGTGTGGLDFYLPRYDLYIECKRFHTARIAQQTERFDNIIVVQGLASAAFVARLLREFNQ